jgi:UDP-glucose:tetrahydrobiopterin glucosyltransferase
VRIIFLSTSVGPLGSGIGGGVELTLRTLAAGLAARGHAITVLAPRGSSLPDLPRAVELVQVDGALHVPSQTLDRTTKLHVPDDSVLTAMWNLARDRAASGSCDVVLNFAYDALPFVDAPIAVPTVHLVSMGSLSDEMDSAVRSALAHDSRCIAMHTRAQAATFGTEVLQHAHIVLSGIDLANYHFVAQPGNDIAFVSRISREKGIDDLFRVAALSGRQVQAFGVMEDEAAWREAQVRFPQAVVRHAGFLSTRDLAARLGQCAALVMVHRWVEAFGNVAIEALACGVPVVTYDRGGPAEIVDHGVTGYVVTPDDPTAVVAALSTISAIDRAACRAAVAARYSASAFAERVECWLDANVADR